MIYLSWAALFEGATDRAYFEALIPRMMEEFVRTRGRVEATVPQSPALLLGRNGRSVDSVSEEACAEVEAYHIAFIHADTGGRALEAGIANRSTAYRDAMNELCEFPRERCVIIAPRRESEAWVLGDGTAIGSALGFHGNISELRLPATAADAERLRDPKAVLSRAIAIARGRRRGNHDGLGLLSAIAQRQNFAALAGSASFRSFRRGIRDALLHLRCIR